MTNSLMQLDCSWSPTSHERVKGGWHVAGNKPSRPGPLKDINGRRGDSGCSLLNVHPALDY
jgi:hypothetical protein